MLTTTLAIPLVATMLLASSTFAQTGGPSASSAAPSSPSPTTFLTQEQPGQWRASKIDSLDVYNNNDQRIGEIRELLVDHSGHVGAVVIGVGGFFGFHEHDVAVPFDQITWVGVRAGRAGVEAPRTWPEHAVVNMTKDQLLAAPEFKYRP